MDFSDFETEIRKMSNFQSWVVELVDEDLTPPFSELALETKIWVNGADRPLSIINIESMADIDNMVIFHFKAVRFTLL